MKLQLSKEEMEDFISLYGKEKDFDDLPYATEKEKVEFRKEIKRTFTEDDKIKAGTIRIPCVCCQTLLSESEKLVILERLERGKSYKAMCTKCISISNKKYFEKHHEKLKEQRIELRDLVAKDKQEYSCDECTHCPAKDKRIFHRKRNDHVSIGTISLKDYKENCQIVCKKKISIQIL